MNVKLIKFTRGYDKKREKHSINFVLSVDSKLYNYREITQDGKTAQMLSLKIEKRVKDLETAINDYGKDVVDEILKFVNTFKKEIMAAPSI